jgi:hypothetical protein
MTDWFGTQKPLNHVSGKFPVRVGRWVENFIRKDRISRFKI